MLQALRDIKGPLSLNNRFNSFLALGILIFSVALALLFKFLSKKRKEAGALISKKSASEIAYEQLEGLKAKDLIRQGRIKQYYSEISNIIRHYLEDRFLLRASEMTTEEFLFYARDCGQLIIEHRNLLKEFLSACDLVKFAKYVPPPEEAEALFISAKKLVDETREEYAIL